MQRTTTVRKTRLAGFSLVELMVALALSGLIALAAIASLSVARQGFSSVDASAQLRDNARFVTETIQRVVVQGAFQDASFAAASKTNPFNSLSGVNVTPNILGTNNQLAKIASTTDTLTLATDFVSRIGASLGDSNCSGTDDTACSNGSDVLIVRYQTSAVAPGSTVADGAMVNCAGLAETAVPSNASERMTSVFHVAKPVNSTEPALMCSYFDRSTNTWKTEALVEGVESFQVLYGLDGAVGAPNTAFTLGTADGVADRFLNANQMVVAGDPDSAASYNNWQRVRSLRIGLLLRGPPNSAAVRGGTVATRCPLGYLRPDLLIPQDLNGQPTPIATDCIDPPSNGDSELTSQGAEFPRKDATIDDDGRLRQAITFTINVRNAQ
jgi:type IV pilus assembly protein PilW